MNNPLITTRFNYVEYERQIIEENKHLPWYKQKIIVFNTDDKLFVTYNAFYALLCVLAAVSYLTITGITTIAFALLTGIYDCIIGVGICIVLYASFHTLFILSKVILSNDLEL